MLDLKGFTPEVLYTFPNWMTKPGHGIYHDHDFIEISNILEGSVDYRIENRDVHLHAGQILVFNPGVHHAESQPPNSKSLQLHIGFRGIALPGMLPDHLPFADSVVDLGVQHDAYIACARRIVDEAERRDAFGHRLLIQARVVELLCLLMRALPDNAVSVDAPVQKDDVDTSTAKLALVSTAVYYLESHYDEEVALTDLADYLNVSAAHLSRTFKAVRGETITSFLTRLRMDKASQILRDTDMPVNKVAHAVGYQDPFYFSKLFKRYFGSAPSVKQE